MDNSEYNFCCNDFHNDQKNSRGKDGINYKKKAWKKRAINLKHICPFPFYIAYDTKVFFVVPGLDVKKISTTTSISIKKITEVFELRHQVSDKKGETRCRYG